MKEGRERKTRGERQRGKERKKEYREAHFSLLLHTQKTINKKQREKTENENKNLRGKNLNLKNVNIKSQIRVIVLQLHHELVTSCTLCLFTHVEILIPIYGNIVEVKLVLPNITIFTG